MVTTIQTLIKDIIEKYGEKSHNKQGNDDGKGEEDEKRRMEEAQKNVPQASLWLDHI